MDFNQSLILILAGLYYIVTGIFIFFALFTVYILIRYGKSRTVALTGSVIFSMIFLSMLSASFVTLQQLQRAINLL